jgi:DNA-binding MarR family transcriptional regulator
MKLLNSAGSVYLYFGAHPDGTVREASRATSITVAAVTSALHRLMVEDLLVSERIGRKARRTLTIPPDHSDAEALKRLVT